MTLEDILVWLQSKYSMGRKLFLNSRLKRKRKMRVISIIKGIQDQTLVPHQAPILLELEVPAHQSNQERLAKQ